MDSRKHPLPNNECDCCNFDVKAYIDAKLKEAFDPAWLAEKEAEEEVIINGDGPATGILGIITKTSA